MPHALGFRHLMSTIFINKLPKLDKYNSAKKGKKNREWKGKIKYLSYLILTLQKKLKFTDL